MTLINRRAMYLVELAMDFAGRTLKPGGALLMVKVFQVAKGLPNCYKS